MKDVASIVIEFIEKTMKSKNLKLYIAEEGKGKFLAMDEDYNTCFKFDLSFSDSAFLCHTLINTEEGMTLNHSVNIPWTDGKSIREFFHYIQAL